MDHITLQGKPARTMTEELVKLYLAEIMHGDNNIHGVGNERELCSLIWSSEKLVRLCVLLNDCQDRNASHFIDGKLLLELADEAYAEAYKAE